ncbi:ATP-binding protein [Streptomyces sp. NPDC059680]|uniref:ATP-binding protein n=1 Tax=Streptomyces sp. NPDC059680 TaxID=3346904 RepID=UPI0036B64371
MTDPPADAAAVLPIANETDVIRVRQTLRTAAEQAGLGLIDTTKLVTAGSELARNILVYATGSRGTVRVSRVRARDRQGVQAAFSDYGPGIEDMDSAMTDGYSTSGRLGLGLPGAGRLADEMGVTTGPDGTTIVITKWGR